MVLIDELLTELMCQHFFGKKKSSIELWRTARYGTFDHYVVEELSLLKKLCASAGAAVVDKMLLQ